MFDSFASTDHAISFFLEKSFAALPPNNSQQFTSDKALSLSRACLLLACCDFNAKQFRTWMVLGTGVRLVNLFQLNNATNQPDIFSVLNNLPRQEIPCSLNERKRYLYFLNIEFLGRVF
jgi:hypothetical protein